LLFQRRWHTGKEMSAGRGPAQFAASEQGHLADAKTWQSSVILPFLDFLCLSPLYALLSELAELLLVASRRL